MKRKPRKPSEFARIYGSRARVKWVAAFGCVICAARPAQNAHTVTGGTGRKADAATIVPLCATCHRRYDQHKPPFDDDCVRDAVKSTAVRIEALWLATQAAA